MIKMLTMAMDATIVRVQDRPKIRCDSNTDMILKKEGDDV